MHSHINLAAWKNPSMGVQSFVLESGASLRSNALDQYELSAAENAVSCWRQGYILSFDFFVEVVNCKAQTASIQLILSRQL